MNPFRRALVAITPFVFPVLASAHPGHDHGDIPSVIRHPFAGVEHALLVATLVLGVAGAAVLAMKVWRESSRHGSHSRIARFR